MQTRPPEKEKFNQDEMNLEPKGTEHELEVNKDDGNLQSCDYQGSESNFPFHNEHKPVEK